LPRNGNDANEEPVSVPGHPSALNTAFESEVGLEISPLTDGDNGFTWVETRDVTPARTPPFNEIKAKVAASWKAREAAKATRAKAEELVKKLESGTPIEELAAAENAEVQSAQGLEADRSLGQLYPKRYLGPVLGEAGRQDLLDVATGHLSQDYRLNARAWHQL
jgi:peptidyl-prolyl cis-trans isomerase D